MNRELLAKVRDRIAEVGNEHCDMSTYSNGRMIASGEPECGTTACIAGHALAITQGAYDQDYSRLPADRSSAGCWAQALLQLPGRAVFYDEDWPAHYREILRDEGDAKGMLAVCDALLDGVLVFDENGDLRESAF